MYNQASLREFGDGQHIVAFVEVDNPAFQAIKQTKQVTLQVPYFTLNSRIRKPIACDFYFRYKSKYDKRDTYKKLKQLLGINS